MFSSKFVLYISFLLCLLQSIHSEETCAADDATCSEASTIDGLENTECKDNHSSCKTWADKNECEVNPAYMLLHCAKSCGKCGGIEDNAVKEGYNDYGELQEVEGSKREETLSLIQRVNKYMKDEVFTLDKYKSVRHECKNRHSLCAFWAVLGECEANENYMLLNCAPSCFSCEKIDYNARCPRDHSLPNIFKPGDLHRMFENIAYGDEFASFNKTILSRPDNGSKVTDSDSDNVVDGPWVIIIDDFLTEEEINLLIKYGVEEGFERSTDVGARKYDGTYDSYENQSRTSKNSWCKTVCYNDPLVKNILNKIEKLTGVPDQNSEYLQLLQYEVGEFYRTHHDFIPYLIDRNTGPRILTAFLYLNDVEQGGGTNFPPLDITVMPKAGRILLWPNVLNEFPLTRDDRTHHQALPVEKGIKYGANAWLHLRDFKTDYRRNCA